jgi:hypothetical protein
MPLQKPQRRNSELTSVKVKSTFFPSSVTNMLDLDLLIDGYGWVGAGAQEAVNSAPGQRVFAEVRESRLEVMVKQG